MMHAAAHSPLQDVCFRLDHGEAAKPRTSLLLSRGCDKWLQGKGDIILRAVLVICNHTPTVAETSGDILSKVPMQCHPLPIILSLIDTTPSISDGVSAAPRTRFCIFP